VVYDGIRLTPARIAAAALEEGVHVVGLSILSGSHRAHAAEVLARLRAEGLDDVPVVVGGIIPPEDAAELLQAGVSHVFTPKDYDPGAVMAAIVGLLERQSAQAA
jgi:(2R)-ethylmalonyl-CoA mutase